MRVTIALSCSLLFACGSPPGGGDDVGDAGGANPPTLEVALSTTQLHWVDGSADSSSLTATLVARDGTRTDVTDRVTWMVSPSEIGAVAGNVLSASGAAAGPGVITAGFGAIENGAPFEVFLEQTLTGTAPSTAAQQFAAATLDTTGSLAIAYPPADALIPPNLGQLEVHWRDTKAKNVYEVQLSGGYVTLKTYVNSLGAATYQVLAADQWERLSQGTSGVDLEVRVRGIANATPTTFIEGTETVRIAAEAIRGGVYWWTTNNGSNAFIYRYDMMEPTKPPEKFYPQTGQTGCIGCHAVSRDGTVVAYRQEGGNLNFGNSLQVATLNKQLTANTQKWNYAAVHPNNKHLFTTTEAGLFVTDLDTKATAPLYTTNRISHPDVSVDGKHIVATQVMAGSEVYTTASKLVMFDYNEANKTVGAPRDFAIPPAGGAFPFYPSFSPDDQWVLYNQAVGDDAYDNPNAELWVKLADGSGNPIRLTAAEVAGTYNSWPKFTPFVSSEPSASGANEKVIWFTVASRRGFGVRSTNTSQTPQLWLAPFYPERAARNEPSTGPAIRLPFQNLTQGNHIAQWTQQIVSIQ